jgi:protein gp37
MADKSGIEWTDSTWNPTTGCDQVSPGCDHCYALTMAKRLKAMGSPAYQRDGDPATSGPGFGLTLHPDRLEQPLRWTRPRKVFVNSMSDLFHKDVPDEFIAQVFAVMALASQHTFQVLTKRHARMRSLLSSQRFVNLVVYMVEPRLSMRSTYAHPWPLPNVVLGVSVEDQHWADIRVPALLATPAAVRFLSCEPLLGPVTLWDPETCDHKRVTCEEIGCWRAIDWVIVGGESGPGARPMHPAWARSLRDQCDAAGVPFLFKQWGEWAPNGMTGIGVLTDPRDRYIGDPVDDDGFRTVVRRVGKHAAGRVLDGVTHDGYPQVATTPAGVG